jgi:hypothetical protein
VFGQFSLANAAPGVKVPSGSSKRGRGLMKWRSTAGGTHPLAIPLLGAASAYAFGSLYWLVGIGDTPLHGALTFAVLYGSTLAVVFGIGGIVRYGIKLLAIRGNSSKKQSQQSTQRHTTEKH